MTETDYYREECGAAQLLLDRWRGSNVQLWAYTAAHATLTLRLFADDRPGMLYLECSGCLSISGPVFYERGALQVFTQPCEPGDPLFVVQDTAREFRVTCRAIFASEGDELSLSPATMADSGSRPSVS